MKSTKKTPATSATPDRLTRYLHIGAAVLSLAGLTIAIYLTVKHLTGQTLECAGGADCSKVLGSEYATIGPVPVAAFGALAYFTTFSLAVLAAFARRRAETLLVVVVALMLGATMWFVYLQRFVLHAFCTFCLASAWIVLTLTVIVSVLLVRKPAR